MQSDDRHREHVEDLLGSPEFRRAPTQAQALEAMVKAAAEGRAPTGSELALIVYGRSDEAYLKAIRQVARDLRFKLVRYYQAHPSPVQIVLSDTGYRISWSSQLPARTEEPPPSAARPAFRRWIGVGLASGLGFSLVAWVLLGSSSAGSPARFEVAPGSLAVLDRDGVPIPVWNERVLAAAGLQPLDRAPDLDLRQRVRGLVSESGPELLVVSCPSEGGRPCSLLRLRTSTGQVVSRFAAPIFSGQSSYPAEVTETSGESHPASFVVRSMEQADLDGDGRRDELILALGHTDIFPTQVLALDDDGNGGWRVLVDYWSLGKSWAFALPDRDGDRRDEIVIFGTRNADHKAFASILPGSAAARGYRARSPGGARALMLRELEGYPEGGGLVVRFPRSALADATRSELASVHSFLDEIRWLPDRNRLEFTVLDGASNPGVDRALRMEFDLEGAGPGFRLEFVDYDRYLAELQALIRHGSLEDRWGIARDRQLASYARELVAQVECREDGDPRWTPCDPQRLATLFLGAAGPQAGDVRSWRAAP